MPIRETLLRTRDLTVATTKATTAASESRCEGDADDDRMRGEGGREGSGDHGHRHPRRKPHELPTAREGKLEPRRAVSEGSRDADKRTVRGFGEGAGEGPAKARARRRGGGAVGHERRERGCRGTLGEVAKRASRRQPVDDPKDVAEAAGEPILDATGCAKWTGIAARVEGAEDAPEPAGEHVLDD